MQIRIDHLVILVRDLEEAARDYGLLGFTVTAGGEHADGLTRNALIPLRDGTYLELVAFLDPNDDQDNVWGWRSLLPFGEALVDHCAASDDLERDVRALRERGLAVKGPTEGGRRLPDGTEIRWLSASFEQDGRVLPFLIEDLTDRSLRVPSGPATEHPNGATGFGSLTLAVPDLQEDANLLARVADERGSGRFRLGPHTLTLAGPEEDEDVRRRLDAGSGPYAATLTAGADGGWLDERAAHGARLRLVKEN